ncbi:MAG: TraB/GumN family protein [Verrucomicrobia bacterium]|nr:TraB/GumN family protein [Verrucomicrobiota bacterium]MCH8510100.1 TraB/GumN family protein [Kiritimatiellia bacterium]
MNTILQYLPLTLSLLLAIVPVSVRTEEALEDPTPEHPVKPMLWKIEGEDLQQPSYLFGTIHLGGGPLDHLHPAAEKAFKEATLVLTEIPFDDKTQFGIVAKIMRDDGKTLSQSIGPDLSQKLDEELRAINRALNSRPFQAMRTWAIAVMLPQLESQLAGDTAMDKMIWDRAVKDGKETDAMETAEFQVGLFDAFTEAEQVTLLSVTLRILREERAEGKNTVRELTDAYIQGDAELIKRMMEASYQEMREGPEKELGEKFYDILLTQRDETMAATIVERLKAAPDTVHFFAAGTAHFTGENSIPSHLEKAGYRIIRVEE